MTSETTSPVEAPGAEAALAASGPALVPSEPAGSMLGEWKQFLAFVRRPRLPQRAADISGRSLAATLRMLALDLLAMLALLTLVFLASLTGFEPPQSVLAELDFGPLIIFAIVIAAPLMEEIAFRGWLSGRPAAFWSVLILLASIGGVAVFGGDTPGVAVGAAQLLAVIAALVLLFVLRKRAPYGWFTRLFPLFFWLSTLAFALIHLTNYNEDASLMLILFTVPQFISGSIFGYVRVQYGLWSSILLHMLHNGTIMALVLAALSAGAEIG